jgi:hypothetical protein
MYIGSNAFQNAEKLQYNGSFGNQLIEIGQRAFNGALTASSPVVIRIPPSVQKIDGYGLGPLRIPAGSSLEIGTETNHSNLRYITTNTAFSMNDSNKYTSVTFYSKLYEPGDPDILEWLANATTGPINII